MVLVVVRVFDVFVGCVFLGFLALLGFCVFKGFKCF